MQQKHITIFNIHNDFFNRSRIWNRMEIPKYDKGYLQKKTQLNVYFVQILNGFPFIVGKMQGYLFLSFLFKIEGPRQQ